MSSAKPEPEVVFVTEERNGETFYEDGEKECDEPGVIPAKYRGTAADRIDMKVMGKEQVLRVGVCPTSHIRRRE